MDLICCVPVSFGGRERSWEQKEFVEPNSLTVRRTNITQCMQKQCFYLNGFVVAGSLHIGVTNINLLPQQGGRGEGRSGGWVSN